MANKIYECKFASEKGEDYIFELWDLDVTGHSLSWGGPLPYKLDIAKGGVQLKYNGDVNNPSSPIITSTCTVDLVIRNSKQYKIIEQLPSAHDYQIACKIYRVVDGTSNPFWYGLLAPEQVVTDLGLWPVGCSLTFTDGLAFLKDVELTDADGQRLNRGYHLRGYIGYCLSKLPHFSAFWGATEDFFYSMSDLYHADHEDSGTIYDPLRYSHIHSDVFYVEREDQNPFGRGFYTKESRATAYDVIEDIMIAFGMRFMHSAGGFYAYSPVPLRGSASVSGIRYKNDRRAMEPGSTYDFSESESDNVSSTINIENDLSQSHVIELGSKRTFLPPIKRAILTHKNGGSQRIFPNTDIFYVDWKWFAGDNNHILRFPLSTLGAFDPNVPIDAFSPTAPTAMFGPVEVNSDDFDLVIPEGLGFTLTGTMEATFWSPDMSDNTPDQYFFGGRSNEMLGAKPVVRMKLRVGNYYLKQTLRQTTSSDFPTNSVMQNSNWGRVNIGASQIGVPAGDREFFPLVVDDLAQWTTDSSDTFDFALIQPGLVGIGASGNPDSFIEVPTIAYREVNSDGDVEETRYPVGLYLKIEEGLNNNNDTELRYSTQSLNLWGGALGADPPITVLSLPIRLEIPPLPAQAGDQSEVEIDFSVFAYSSEGTLQPDTLDTTIPYSAAANAHHVQNVFHPHNPRIRNFNLYAGSDDEDSDVIYSSQLNRNYEVIDIGETTIGSKVTEDGFNTVLTTQSAPMATGGAADSYQQDPDWESFGMTETDNDLLQLAVHSRTLLQGVPQEVLDLTLIARQGATALPYLWQRQKITLDGTEYSMIPLDMAFNLSSARVDVVGLVYDTTSTYNPGGDPVFGKNLASYGRAQSTVQATGDGAQIDNKGPQSSGGGLSAADQAKLAAITMTGSDISDFTTTGTVLDSDAIDDASSTHKFATASQLNQIAQNDADITTNGQAIGEIQGILKATFTNDGAGVYVDTTDTDKSHVSITETTGKLQVGQRTTVDMTESSPGTIALKVQAGQSGSEAQVTAINIQGDSTLNTKATVQILGGDFRCQSPFQFSGGGAFSAGQTVTFAGDTSGIDYGDLDNTPTIPGSPLAAANQTLGGDRTIDGGGSHELEVHDVTEFKVTNTAGATAFSVTPGAPSAVQVNGNFSVDSAQVTGGSIRLEEANLVGSNYIELKAPISITNDVTLTFPDGAGSSGQVLQTNGSGTLSWVSKLGDTNPLVKGVLTIGRITVGNVPRLYIKGEDDLAGVMLKAPDAISTDVTFQLPETDGSNGQVLQTDGSGNLSFATVSGGGGGGGPIILGNISGRYMWSSADDGERIHTGNFSYGPFNWYNFTSEPSSSTFRAYTASDTVGTTTTNLAASHLIAYGFMVPTTDKKVKIHYAFRLQNAPASSTWGFSLWGANRQASGSTSSSTATLRAETSDLTQSSNSSSRVFHGSFETTADFSEGVAVLMAENRSGSLTTTTFMYAQYQIELID